MINRKIEQAFINKKMNTNKPELLVIYGRRRVGKTFLLENSFESPIFFTADLSNPTHLMNNFVNPLKDILDLPKGITISSWDEFFQLLVNAIKKMEGKHAIIFDEFQYIPQKDDSFMSILQKWWDKEFSNLPVLIVLCGSFIGMIEKIALSASSPLYGRRTGQYLIQPMNFFDSSLFLNDMTTEERIKTYSITGGIPLYLNEFRSFSSFEKALKEKILSPGEFLLEEGRFTTLEEFSKDSGSYFDILRVVASGRTKPNEISALTGISYSGIGTYLSKLVDLRFLKRELPISLKKPRKTPFYYIDDDYLRFYFRYLYSNKELVYREKGELLSNIIQETFSEFVSFTFEKIAMQYLEETVGPEKIGRWWKKGEVIDIVAIRENNLYVCEVKCTNKPVNNKVLQKLQRKTGLLLEDLNQDFDNITYFLFSKSGFEEINPQENLVMISLNDIELQTKKHSSKV